MSLIHESYDTRNIDIDFIGVKNFKLPFIFQSDNEYITIGNFKVGVFLKGDKKGAHLSWIVEVLNESVANKRLSIKDMLLVTNDLSKKLDIDDIEFDVEFTTLIPEKTPISLKISNREVLINLHIVKKGEEISQDISIGLNGAMTCPNSKAISKYGAHSQRCFLKANICGDLSILNIDEVSKIISSSFSAPVFSLVKSVDEKAMTEMAYENPKFTEDLIRDCIIKLKTRFPNYNFCVEAENFESIHSHNVYAKGRCVSD